MFLLLNCLPELVLQVQPAHVLRDRLARLVLSQEVVDRVEGLGVSGGHDEVADCGLGGLSLPLVDTSQGMRQVGESAERSSVKFRHLICQISESKPGHEFPQRPIM